MELAGHKIANNEGHACLEDMKKSLFCLIGQAETLACHNWQTSDLVGRVV